MTQLKFCGKIGAAKRVFLLDIKKFKKVLDISITLPYNIFMFSEMVLKIAKKGGLLWQKKSRKKQE